MWLAYWFSSLFKSFFFFFQVIQFPLPNKKTNISKFQFDQETVDKRTPLWISPEIPIYLSSFQIPSKKEDHPDPI